MFVREYLILAYCSIFSYIPQCYHCVRHSRLALPTLWAHHCGNRSGTYLDPAHIQDMVDALTVRFSGSWVQRIRTFG